MSAMQSLKNVLAVDDPVRRRALFALLLCDEVELAVGKRPVMVGDYAVELHTYGAYASPDITLKGPFLAIRDALKGMGFTEHGKNAFAHIDDDMQVHWQGEELDPGNESPERVVETPTDGERTLQVICREDLVVDRLASAKSWHNPGDFSRARRLMKAKLPAGQTIDREYLQQRAEEQGVEDELNLLLDEIDCR